MPESSPDGSAENVNVPFDRVAGMVRHLTHDIRNGLNTLDLQAAFLQELVAGTEAIPEVKRFRAMISNTAKGLQGFSSSFWLAETHPVTYSAKIFMEDFRSRLASALPEGAAAQISWTETLKKESITVDLEQIFRAMSECFKN